MVKIKDEYFDVDQFLKEIHAALLRDYTQGVLFSSQQLDRKPAPIDSKIVDLLAEISLNLIKGVTKEMSKRITMTIQQGILEGKTNQQIAEDLDSIFDKSNPTRFNYEERLNAVARTERQRALNQGAFDNAVNTGATKKYLAVVMDNRTSCICGDIFSGKYGSPDDAIPIDEEFEGTCNGKVYVGQKPPFHPHCRTGLRFIL